jgi:FMN phosphatase YigB (HAD superfamily)
MMTTEAKDRGRLILALDIDGVVVHPTDGIPSWDANIADDLGIDPALLSSAFFRSRWSDVVTGRRDLLVELQEFLGEIDSPVTPERLVDYWFRHDGRVDQTVVETVSRWRAASADRVVLAVSNQEKHRVEFLMNSLGLNRLFDGGIWSYQIGTTKSKPEFYELANDKWMVGASSVTFFDDEAKHVDLATNAGWRAFLYRSVADLESGLPG